MLEYLHFVPGRLRLKTSQLRDRSRAAKAEACVAAISAVKSAAANPTTGSLTITFDERRLSLEALWEALGVHGYVSGSWPESAPGSGPSPPVCDAGRLGRAVAAALLDAVLQHSARAVVRALL